MLRGRVCPRRVKLSPAVEASGLGLNEKGRFIYKLVTRSLGYTGCYLYLPLWLHCRGRRRRTRLSRAEQYGAAQRPI